MCLFFWVTVAEFREDIAQGRRLLHGSQSESLSGSHCGEPWWWREPVSESIHIMVQQRAEGAVTGIMLTSLFQMTYFCQQGSASKNHFSLPLWTQNVYKKKLFLSSKSIRPGFRCSQLAFTEHVCSCKTLGTVTFISTLFFIDNVQVLKRFKFKIEAMYNRTWKQSQSPRRARGHPGGSGVT